MSEIRDQKHLLREKYEQYRASLGQEERDLRDAAITERFIGSVSYRHAKVILAYASKGTEVSTRGIIKHALQSGKNVALPVSDRASSTMTFYAIESADDLRDGAFGISEPSGRETVPEGALTLCIVPGIVYDREGYRIGYGKGFYDRFLQNYEGVRIGLCYEECVLDRLPRGRYDTHVDAIITQKGIIGI